MPTLMLAMLTWTTWGRAPQIKPGHAAALSGLLPRLAEKGGAVLTELSVVSNHVHTILRIGPRCDLPRLVQYMKGGSALLLNRLIEGQGRIRWAEGYDLRSVDLRSLPQVRYYLNNQGRHHGVPLLVRWSVVNVEQEVAARRRERDGTSVPVAAGAGLQSGEEERRVSRPSG
jgi:REP element-mobilizing transposase RayT